MNEHDNNIIIQKAVELAENSIQSITTSDCFNDLETVDQRTAVIRSVVTSSIVAIGILIDAFGEDAVNSILEELEREADEINVNLNIDSDIITDIDKER